MKFETLRKNREIRVVWLLILTGLFLFPFLYSFFGQKKVKMESTADLLVMVFLGALWGYVFFFGVLPGIIDLFIANHQIEITPTQIVGQNVFGRRAHFRIDEVLRIGARRRRFQFPWPNIYIEDKHGRRLHLHANIESYGDCVEELRKRCQNVRRIDYCGLDARELMWKATNKKFMW